MALLLWAFTSVPSRASEARGCKMQQGRWGAAKALFALVIGLLVATSAPAAVADQTDTSTVAQSPKAGLTFLFVVSSKSGRITGIGADTGKETLTLTLRGVSDHATQFADRPFRDAYVLSTQDLAKKWNRWFASSAPNAVLSYRIAGDYMPHNIVVQLWSPRYDSRAQTLTFTAKHTHRSQDPSPDATAVVTLPHRKAPAQFTAGTLFIDSVGGSPDAYWLVVWKPGYELISNGGGPMCMEKWAHDLNWWLGGYATENPYGSWEECHRALCRQFRNNSRCELD